MVLLRHCIQTILTAWPLRPNPPLMNTSNYWRNFESGKVKVDTALLSQHDVVGWPYWSSQFQTAQQLHPSVIIVEEAAHVLRCTSSQGWTLTQYIWSSLVMTNKTNRITKSLKFMATSYSLFEKIWSEMEWNIKTSMSTQNETRDLQAVSSTHLSNLIDHESVFNYPHIKGMDQGRVFLHTQSHE